MKAMRIISLALFVFIIHSKPLRAIAATVSVICPSQTISKAISNQPFGEPLNINVVGACADNIEIPQGRIVYINGINGASLSQNLSTKPVLKVNGYVSISNLIISSTKITDLLVFVNDGGFISFDSSQVNSNSANVLIQVFSSGAVNIYNTDVIGGLVAAISATSGTINIGGYGGKTFRISSPNNTAGESLGCYQSHLNINAGPSSTINIGPGSQGLSAKGCAASIGSATGAGLVNFVGNTEAAIRAKGGDSISLRYVTISNNAGTAIDVRASSVDLEGSVRISGNGAGLFSRRDGIITLNNGSGINTISGPTPFRCYQNGRVYSEVNSLNVTDSTNCLIVGGTISN